MEMRFTGFSCGEEFCMEFVVNGLRFFAILRWTTGYLSIWISGRVLKPEIVCREVA
ncbi:uncharacterized protein LY89DRAFT_680125 [Mollisia scopiformis]|uniref:Uncharacterized protein n=1 Tax=Mollisia scopiformis TaxID=149040 RepID=A0A194XT36_MOLSC|nr:uncharacterized protein LY89DRAFT_680125 [Mollisia scopiformis]KUJ23363.1 hypothetical protein LY89DRAFT_680125 [Mollisia scopiformis]